MRISKSAVNAYSTTRTSDIDIIGLLLKRFTQSTMLL